MAPRKAVQKPASEDPEFQAYLEKLSESLDAGAKIKLRVDAVTTIHVKTQEQLAAAAPIAYKYWKSGPSASITSSLGAKELVWGVVMAATVLFLINGIPASPVSIRLPSLPKILTGGGSSHLNDATIASVLSFVPSQGDWAGSYANLESVLHGKRLTSNKANGVLFACGAMRDSDVLATMLEDGFSKEDVVVLPVGSVPADREALEQGLAEFFKERPHGVVLLEGLETITLDAASVLVDALAPNGHLLFDDEEVSTTKGTFYITTQVRPEAMAQTTAATFTNSAKSSIRMALLDGVREGFQEGLSNTLKLLQEIDVITKVSN